MKPPPLIMILVAMGAGTVFALDHPRLPHRVLHVISPAQLEATCPGTFACAIVYWGKRTCHVYVPNAHLPGWPSRRQLLAHEFRHCRVQEVPVPTIHRTTDVGTTAGAT
jgi:hypothetical protein